MLPNTPQNPVPQQPQTGAGDDSRQRQQRGTGFTNINRILGANQGAGQKLGQAIGGGLAGQAGQVKQGIQQGQSQFQAGMQQGSQGANTAINQGRALQQQAGEANETYEQRLANAQNVDQQGQALQNAAYGGPQGLQNAGQIQAQAANVGALGRLAGTSAGQSQLLRSQVAQRGNYTQGQNSLDQLLLGQGGQQAVQQGRHATIGLPQQANVATQNAQNQAAATTSAINNNRIGALQNLQDRLSGDQGFTEQAKKQATQFNESGQRLSQLLSGKDSAGNAITQLSDSDKDLLGHMQDYGIDPQSVYNKNPDDARSAVDRLSSSLTQNFGAAKYNGSQQAAAQNLAKFLGQGDTADQIGKNQFNNDLFQGDQNAIFNKNQEAYKYDKETQGILNDLGQKVQGLEQGLGTKNTQARDNQLKSIDEDQSLSAEEKNNLKNIIGERFDTAQNALTSGNYDQAAQAKNAGDVFAMGNVAQDPRLSKYLSNNGLFQSSLNQGDADVASALSPYQQYGWLGFGDRSADAGSGIDPRFANLGLGAETGRGSGQVRSSQSLLGAANKAAGENLDLRQYVLNKYLNNNGGT